MEWFEGFNWNILITYRKKSIGFRFLPLLTDCTPCCWRGKTERQADVIEVSDRRRLPTRPFYAEDGSLLLVT